MSERGIGRERIDKDNKERFRGLRKPLGVSSFGVNQMTMLPGQRGRIHRHERQEELFIVVEGTLTVETEADTTEVGAGEMIRIAPELKRQLSNRGDGPVHLVGLGGYGNHEGRDGIAFANWDEPHGAPPQEVPLPEDLPA